jgi:hypothetical protein
MAIVVTCEERSPLGVVLPGDRAIDSKQGARGDPIPSYGVFGSKLEASRERTARGLRDGHPAGGALQVSTEVPVLVGPEAQRDEALSRLGALDSLHDAEPAHDGIAEVLGIVSHLIIDSSGRSLDARPLLAEGNVMPVITIGSGVVASPYRDEK